MEIGFDGRTLVVNHVVYALWTLLLVPLEDPLSMVRGDVGVGFGAVLALWGVSGLALVAIDCIVAYRLLASE
ncbi:hypothetical protein G9C85_18360 [Halorubellus sp. JP-L1]|uniref:hypothetical protein n=1 Tax=Halorubellus sp. JP-L1 TaxID=2715753 RepID=UPI00140CFF67|nr:hypothetical protein [Halorubellus sp. JP-L1]NHN43586.1 hypothetical protein [Halorubellus sp. JP-L1]